MTGKSKHAHSPIPKNALPATSASEDIAFKAMILGGAGLLFSTLLGIGLARSVSARQFHTAQTFLAVERKAWEKKQAGYDLQRDQLIADLQEAQHSKAEMNSLRQHASRQFQEFFQTMPVACFCFAANGRIIRWNAACEGLYGIPAAEALKSTIWETIIAPEEREAAEANVQRVLGGESLIEMERWDRHPAGTALVRSSMVPMHDAGGGIIGVLSAGIGMDTARKLEGQVTLIGTALEETRGAIEDARIALEAEKAERARLQAILSSEDRIEVRPPQPLRDSVTGQWGYRAFHEQLKVETERAARYSHSLSVLMLDLDGFSRYNRALGFEAGDTVLTKVGMFLESKVRTIDIIARLGADDFAIILPETGQAGARMAAERIRSGIIGIARADKPFTACLGIAVLSLDTPSSDALAERALEALYGAKSQGANSVFQYGEGLIPATPL